MLTFACVGLIGLPTSVVLRQPSSWFLGALRGASFSGDSRWLAVKLFTKLTDGVSFRRRRLPFYSRILNAHTHIWRGEKIPCAEQPKPEKRELFPRRALLLLRRRRRRTRAWTWRRDWRRTPGSITPLVLATSRDGWPEFSSSVSTIYSVCPLGTLFKRILLVSPERTRDFLAFSNFSSQVTKSKYLFSAKKVLKESSLVLCETRRESA